MKSISARNYQKHYILNLLPTVKNHDEITYVATVDEVDQWHTWLRQLTRHLVTDPVVGKNIMQRIQQLKRYGGVVASIQTVFLPLEEGVVAPHLVYLDLNYSVAKEVQLMIGGLDVTAGVATSDKLTGLLNRFMKELYDAYEQENDGTCTDSFIEELFLVDDVDMVIDERNRFRVQVAPSLRDYLVALNRRLRVNAS